MRSDGERLRIRVSEPVRLRDYFLRLGTQAEIVTNGDGDLVVVNGGELDVRPFLESWSAANGIGVAVEPAAAAAELPRVATIVAPRPRLGDLLLRKGMITESQLDEGLAESHATGDLLGRILLRRQWIFEDELARSLAEQLELPYVNLRHSGIDYALARALPMETGMHFAAIPIGVRGNSIRVAFADPCDEDAHRAVAAYLSEVDPVVAELSDIETAWRTVARRYFES